MDPIVSPRKICSILNACPLIWKQVLGRCNQVKMRVLITKKKKNLFSFSMRWMLAHLIVVILSPPVVIGVVRHTLELHSAVCQLYLDETGKKALRSHWIRWVFNPMAALMSRKDDFDAEREETAGKKARGWRYSAARWSIAQVGDHARKKRPLGVLP